MNCKMKTPKYKISPKGKRKLDYPQKKSRSSVKLPLIGKTIYLDVKENKHVKQLQSDLKRLGATLEEFVSRDINYLITAQPRPKNKGQSCQGDESPAASPFNCEPSPSPLNVEDKKVTSVTRGKALAEKARITRKTNTLLDNAEQWGVKIVSLEGAYKWIDKELKKLPKVSGNLSKTQNRAKCVSSYKTLKSPFVKIEAESYCYRPFHIELDVWPRLNVDTPRGSCPFDGTIIKGGEESREERGDLLAAQVDIPSEELQKNNQEETVDSGKPPTDKSCKKSETDATAGSRILTAGELKRRKELKRKQDRKRGYCECCHVKYEDLDKHVKEEQHIVYVKNKANYEKLDTLICTGPNSQHFLAEYMKKSALLSVKRENKSGVSKSSGQNVSPRKSPRKSATQHIAQPYYKSPRKSHPKDTRISLTKQSESGAQAQKKVFKSPRKERENVSKVQENIPPKPGNGGNTPKQLSKAGILEKLDKNTTITIANVVVEGSGIANDDFLSSPRKMRDRKSLTKSAESLCKGEDLLKDTLRSPVKRSPVIDKIRLSKDKQFDMNVKSTQDESNKENIKPGKNYVENDIDTSKPSRKQRNKSNEISESEKELNESKQSDKNCKNIDDASTPCNYINPKVNTDSGRNEVFEKPDNDVNIDMTENKLRMNNLVLVKGCLDEIVKLGRQRICNEASSDDFEVCFARFSQNEELPETHFKNQPNQSDKSFDSMIKNWENHDQDKSPCNSLTWSSRKNKPLHSVNSDGAKAVTKMIEQEQQECEMPDSKVDENNIEKPVVKVDVNDADTVITDIGNRTEKKDVNEKTHQEPSGVTSNHETDHEKVNSDRKRNTQSSQQKMLLSRNSLEQNEKETIDHKKMENDDFMIEELSDGEVQFVTFTKTLAERIKERSMGRRSSVKSYNLNELFSPDLDQPSLASKSDQSDQLIKKKLVAEKKLVKKKSGSCIASAKVVNKYRNNRHGNSVSMGENIPKGYQGDDEYERTPGTYKSKINSKLKQKKQKTKFWHYVVDKPRVESKDQLKDLPKELRLLKDGLDVPELNCRTRTKKLQDDDGNLSSACEDVVKASSAIKRRVKTFCHYEPVAESNDSDLQGNFKDLPKELRMLKNGLDSDISDVNCSRHARRSQNEDDNISIASGSEQVVEGNADIKKGRKKFWHYEPVAESNDSDQQDMFKDLPKELRVLKQSSLGFQSDPENGKRRSRSLAIKSGIADSDCEYGTKTVRNKMAGSNKTKISRMEQEESRTYSDDSVNALNKKKYSRKKKSFWHYVDVPSESDTDKDNESDKNLPKELRKLKGPLGWVNTEVKSRRHSRTPVRANEGQDSHNDCEKDVGHKRTKRTNENSKKSKQANHVNKSDVAVSHKVAALKTVRSVREVDHCVEEVYTDTDEDKDKQKSSKPVRSIQERLRPTECLKTSRRKPRTKKSSEQHQTLVYKIRKRCTNISYAESDVDNSDDFIDEGDAYDTNGKKVSCRGNETNKRGLLQKETVINSDDCTNTINTKNTSQKKKSFWHYVEVPLESDTDKGSENDKNLPKELRELKGPLGWVNTESKSRRHSRTPVRANEGQDSHTDCEKDIAHKEYNRSNKNDESPNSLLKKNINGSDVSDTDEGKEMQQVPKWVRKLQENLSEVLGRSRRKSNKDRNSEQYQTCAYKIRKKETNISYAEIDTDNSDDFFDETNTFDYNYKKLKPKVQKVASSFNVAQEQLLGNSKYELHEKNKSSKSVPKKGTNKRKKFWVYVAEPDCESDEDSALDNMPKELRQLKLWKMKSDIVHGSRSERQEKSKVLNERELCNIVNQNGGSEQCRLLLSKELPVTDSDIDKDKMACGYKEESEHCRSKAKKRKVYWEYEIVSDDEDEAPKTLDKSLPKALRNLRDSWNDVSGETTRHTRQVSSCIGVSDSGKALRNRNETVEQTGSNFDEEDIYDADLVNENKSVKEDKLKYDERSKSPVFNKHQSNKNDVRKRRGSPVFKKSPKSNLCNAKGANKLNCDQKCQKGSDVVNELCPDSDDEVSDIIDEIQDSVKLPESLREIEQAGSGYSRTSRESRRKEWKRKIKELGCKASDDQQDYKRRKLDGQSDNVADSKLEQKFKSPRRRLLTNDVNYGDKNNDVFDSLVDNDATRVVGCQEEKDYDLTWKPVMIQDSERVQYESRSMLNKSLSNEMDIISKLDAQNTRNNHRAFKSNTDKETVSADCNSKQEKVVEINEKDSGKAEEDLEQFVPAISSPGGYSNSSWNGAVDEYLDNSVKNGQDVSFRGCSSSFYTSFHGSPYKSPSKHVSSSPFKATLLNSASNMKSPSKNYLRTPDKTHSSTPTTSPMVRKVDDDIEFNFGSPQKDCTEYSSLRSVKGVVRTMSKPVAFNLTSTPEDRKSKKHICKQD